VVTKKISENLQQGRSYGQGTRKREIMLFIGKPKGRSMMISKAQEIKVSKKIKRHSATSIERHFSGVGDQTFTSRDQRGSSD